MPRRVHLEPAINKRLLGSDYRGRAVQVNHRELEEMLERNFRKLQEFINQLADESAETSEEVAGIEPSVTVEDEAVAIGDATILNFEGAGVTAAIAGDRATVTIPGSTTQLVVPLIAEGANFVDNNATAAARFIGNSHRNVQRVDLTNMTEVRFLVNRQATNGAAGYTLELRYHTAHATTIGTYSQIGTSAVSVNCVTANTYYQTAWIALAAGAKADVYLAIQGSGGDGVLDPAHGSIVAQFR